MSRERFTSHTGPVYKYLASVWESATPCSLLNVQIDVSAKSDCHIWLCDRDHETKGYEIVIGGWRNTRSEIRRGKQGEALSSIFHEESTKPLVQNGGKFWVSVMPTESDVTIVLGKGWDIWKDQIMVAVDRSKKKISKLSQISVSTGFGSEGSWTIYVHTKSDERKVLEEKMSECTVDHEPQGTPAKNRRTSTFSTPIRDTLVSAVANTNSLVSTCNLLKRSRAQTFVQQENRVPQNFMPHAVLSNIDHTISKHACIAPSPHPEPPAKRRR